MSWRPSLEHPWARERPLLDEVAKTAFASRLSQSEEAVLGDTVWASGQDVRLREDIRFRETPWGRWISSLDWLANDVVCQTLRSAGTPWMNLEEALAGIDALTKRRAVICGGDPRIVIEGDRVRLSAQELSDKPLVEDEVARGARYVSHLPVHTLRAAAASEPLGQWGKRAQEEVVETLGWLQVTLPGQRLTDRMFVAEVEGHSMDDGRSGLRDGALAVFELGAADLDSGPIALVRGSFDDPETGSYALKQIRQKRDATDDVEAVRLVSLNADKERYPDIVVREADGGTVSVVARLVAPLAPESFARAPKQAASPRRRDVASEAGTSKHRARLDRAIASFFGPKKEQGPSPEGAPEREITWEAHLELGRSDPLSLTAVCGPLTGLFSKVKIVSVRSGPHQKEILASNLRTKIWREPIAPSCAPYSWHADPFEEEMAADLAPLTIPGFAPDRATLFRMGPDGMGHPLSSRALTPGHTYRVLVPPAFADVPMETGPAWNGWRATEIHVPSPVPPDKVDLLRSIGVVVGPDAYVMDWVVACPSAYERGRDGERYPSYDERAHPHVAIVGPPTLLDGDVMLIVQGAKGTRASLPLPAGEKWLVALSDLPPDRYVAEVCPARTSVETSRLFFRISPDERRLPRAEMDVRWRDRPAIEAGEEDLSGAEQDLSVRVPPFWTVFAEWRSGARVRGPAVTADENGTVDMQALLSRSKQHRRDDVVGDLVVVLGELGTTTMRHRRDLAEAARNELARQIAERGGAISALVGQLDLLLSQWVIPIVTLLGYSHRPVPLLHTFDMKPGFGAALLQTTTRKGESFEKRDARVLVVVPSDLAFSRRSDGHALIKAEAVTLCKKTGLLQAIVTDGLGWAKLRADHKVMGAPIELDDALRRAALGGLDDFLSDFLAEAG